MKIKKVVIVTSMLFSMSTLLSGCFIGDTTLPSEKSSESATLESSGESDDLVKSGRSSASEDDTLKNASESGIADSSREDGNNDGEKKSEQNSAFSAKDYFFSDEGEYSYDVKELMLEDTDNVKVKVKVSKRAEYTKGMVYSITIIHDECPGSKDVDGSDRFKLGLFYVTDEEIYYLQDLTDKVPTEDDFLKNGISVCSKDDEQKTKDTYELRIEHDNDICRYRCWDTAVETGWYCRMEWTRGKGLTYYRSGYGAGGNPIDISMEGVEVNRDN